MNNYGRNQVNNRTRQGNMQYQNRMNRDNCGCDNTPRPADNCGCNTPAPVDNCGCNAQSGLIQPRRTTENCGYNTPNERIDHHPSGTAGCNASRYDQLSGMALAIAYVPWQTYCQLYELEEALCHGTIFKELDLNFMRGCCS